MSAGGSGGERVDVLVVGGGIMGLAAAEALARTGLDVLLLEQFSLGHRRGSSHGATRVFRLSYPDARYVRLAQRALEGWRRLEAESGETLLAVTGLLDVAHDLGPYRDALDACGVPWQELDADEVAARFAVTLPAGTSALFQPDAGVTYADRAQAAFRAGVVAHGGRIVDGTRVLALARGREGVRASTETGDVVARAVIVTAGAWVDRLLAPLGIELPVVPTRETVVYFRLDGVPPAVLDETTRPRGEAAYALADTVYGLKVGLHRSGLRTNPDGQGLPDPEIVALAAEWARERFPLADGEPAAAETCLYTNAPGEEFLLERHDRVVVGSPCSGHGFKFAPEIGAILAGRAREALEL